MPGQLAVTQFGLVRPCNGRSHRHPLVGVRGDFLHQVLRLRGFQPAGRRKTTDAKTTRRSIAESEGGDDCRPPARARFGRPVARASAGQVWGTYGVLSGSFGPGGVSACRAPGATSARTVWMSWVSPA